MYIYFYVICIFFKLFDIRCSVEYCLLLITNTAYYRIPNILKKWPNIYGISIFWSLVYRMRNSNVSCSNFPVLILWRYIDYIGPVPNKVKTSLFCSSPSLEGTIVFFLQVGQSKPNIHQLCAIRFIPLTPENLF